MPDVASASFEGGAMGQNRKRCTLPCTPMLWISIATGKHHFQHGIHGFSGSLQGVGSDSSA